MVERRRYVAVMWAAARSSCWLTALARTKLSRNGSGTWCCAVLRTHDAPCCSASAASTSRAGQHERAPGLQPALGRVQVVGRHAVADGERGARVRSGIVGALGVDRKTCGADVAGERGAGQVEPLAVGHHFACHGQRVCRLEQQRMVEQHRSAQVAPPLQRLDDRQRLVEQRACAALAERELAGGHASAAPWRRSTAAARPPPGRPRSPAARVRAGPGASSRMRCGCASAPPPCRSRPPAPARPSAGLRHSGRSHAARCASRCTATPHCRAHRRAPTPVAAHRAWSRSRAACDRRWPS